MDYEGRKESRPHRLAQPARTLQGEVMRLPEKAVGECPRGGLNNLAWAAVGHRPGSQGQRSCFQRCSPARLGRGAVGLTRGGGERRQALLGGGQCGGWHATGVAVPRGSRPPVSEAAGSAGRLQAEGSGVSSSSYVRDTGAGRGVRRERA